MNYMILAPFAQTTRDSQIIHLLEERFTQKQVAEKLGIGERTVARRVSVLRSLAGKGGIDPSMNRQEPLCPGFEVIGTSYLRDPKTGENKLEWVKTRQDKASIDEAMRIALEALKEDIPRQKLSKKPKFTNSDLASMYVITDYHLGMMAWGEETGDEDWDLDKAEQLLENWFTYALSVTPSSEVGILAQLGDFLHFDSLLPVTPAHKHVLDASSRFQLVVRVAIRLLRKIIDMMLQKHDQLHIVLATGNHDEASSTWLQEMFDVFYENEPRITVNVNPDPYYAFEFGNTSLFWHHGHKKKLVGLPEVFAGKFRTMYGRTEHSYGHTGHLHHQETKENNLMVMEQHRTLAPDDAYSSGLGFSSGRGASAITYHKKYGEIGRFSIPPQMAIDHIKEK